MRASAGSTVVGACVPSAVLPQSFRAASAKHRSKTKPTQRRISKSNSNTGHGNWATSGYSSIRCILPTSPSATFREGHPSAKLPRLNPVRFLMNNYHRKLLHKNAKKERNSNAQQLLGKSHKKLPYLYVVTFHLIGWLATGSYLLKLGSFFTPKLSPKEPCFCSIAQNEACLTSR